MSQVEETGQAPVNIQFALVSHTNNGKTTLVRTLVGVDVGEVRDAAHVTVFAESHTLLTTPQGDSLSLWDTPGFGDSVRLLRRLAQAGNPIGWFLREVYDRYRDRTFWLSQNALRTAKDAADIVLYLVNSSEHPQDAGYLASEMKILEWVGKPVVVLLNQMGPPRPGGEEAAELLLWKRQLDQYPIVRDVLPLDAFARCWVHERVFYEAIGRLIEPAQAAGYARLFGAWEQSNLRRYRAAMGLIAAQMADAIGDSEAVEEESKSLLRSAMNAVGLRKGAEQRQEKAMAVLLARLNARVAASTTDLLVLHQLDPHAAATINARVRHNFAIRAPVDKAQAGLIGAIVSGAATGVSADLMAGGMTLGAGALLGSLVGALTFAGAAWGFNATTDRNHPVVEFAGDFLNGLLVSAILRYLAVAHFGRGRGNFVESEAPPFWQAEVEAAMAAHSLGLAAAFDAVRADPKAVGELEAVVDAITARTLERLYPATPLFKRA